MQNIWLKRFVIAALTGAAVATSIAVGLSMFSADGTPDLFTSVFIVVLGAAMGALVPLTSWLDIETPDRPLPNRPFLVRALLHLAKAILVGGVMCTFIAFAYSINTEVATFPKALAVGLIAGAPLALAYLLFGKRAKRWVRNIFEFFTTFAH